MKENESRGWDEGITFSVHDLSHGLVSVLGGVKK